MASEKRRRLETAVSVIQQRWGFKALRRLGQTDTQREVPCVPTGFSALDAALGIGGLPRGRITEIIGTRTSGMSTLALKTVSVAQDQADVAVYMDLGRTFDPDYAARCGVKLDRLHIVRPFTGREALEITQVLVVSGGVGILVFDTVSHLLREPLSSRDMAASLRQLNVALDRSPCVLIFLTSLSFGDISSDDNYPEGFALPDYAAIRMWVKVSQWIRKRRDIGGYRVRVGVLKNKLGPAGKNVTIDITFDGVVQGNGT